MGTYGQGVDASMLGFPLRDKRADIAADGATTGKLACSPPFDICRMVQFRASDFSGGLVAAKGPRVVENRTVAPLEMKVLTNGVRLQISPRRRESDDPDGR